MAEPAEANAGCTAAEAAAAAAPAPAAPAAPAPAPTTEATTEATTEVAAAAATEVATAASGSVVSVEAFEARMANVEELLAREDPEQTPFKSIYDADDVLNNLLKDVERSALAAAPEQKAVYEDMSAVAHYVLGIDGLNSDDNSAGERNLTLALAHLNPEGTPVKLQWVPLVIDSLNRLGVLWNDRGNYELAEKWLSSAEKVYNEWKLCTNPPPMPFAHTGHKHDVESMHTHTLYYIAQMYTICKKTMQAASYCYQTLKRQRETNKFVPTEWAMNCASLAGYYTENRMFAAAEQCLSIAQQTLPAGPENEENRANLFVARGHFYMDLLESEEKRCKSGEPEEAAAGVPLTERLFGLDNGECEFVKLVPVKAATQAKRLFDKSMEQLQQGTQYYVLDGFVSDHIKILYDMVKLYELVMYFEPDDNIK
eukprot:TRINITY_DN3711_c1_g1_i2.p1 TRINITY_DN3711_c1_g1~~TRINITY_DN3711_c1_g1_i2.p1  ORF type:complete len:426 (+),score=168.11 TRINITY_DN3711_c1_g1_i2:64-1341(+)